MFFRADVEIIKATDIDQEAFAIIRLGLRRRVKDAYLREVARA